MAYRMTCVTFTGREVEQVVSFEEEFNSKLLPVCVKV